MMKIEIPLQGKDVFSTHQPENGVAKAPPGITQRLFELIPSASHEVRSFPAVPVDPHLQQLLTWNASDQLSSTI